MINALIGIKVDQSQFFTEEGLRIPVTNVKAGPCFVTGIKNEEKDGYNAIQLGLGKRRASTLSRAILGNMKKAGLEKDPPRFLREIRVENKTDLEDERLKLGTTIKISDLFAVGDKIEVTGISKGKGFQGGVKRHHFKGGPRTHGQSDRERAPGSIGQTTTPGRVYKGKRMAGRMGNDQIKVKNLKIIALNDEENIIVLSGLVPGGRNSVLTIKNVTKKG
jgi:large subunit ribosomal protein L3